LTALPKPIKRKEKPPGVAEIRQPSLSMSSHCPDNITLVANSGRVSSKNPLLKNVIEAVKTPPKKLYSTYPIWRYLPKKTALPTAATEKPTVRP
jgi:hypothetical protein